MQMLHTTAIRKRPAIMSIQTNSCDQKNSHTKPSGASDTQRVHRCEFCTLCVIHASWNPLNEAKRGEKEFVISFIFEVVWVWCCSAYINLANLIVLDDSMPNASNQMQTKKWLNRNIMLDITELSTSNQCYLQFRSAKFKTDIYI